MHDRVVDTALVFPHKKGLPYKRSLKALMTEHLMKFIQNDIGEGKPPPPLVECVMSVLLCRWRSRQFGGLEVMHGAHGVEGQR